MRAILTIFLTLLVFSARGQTELVVEFRKGEKVTKTKDFKFSIVTEKDTLNVFNSVFDKEIKQNKISTSLDTDTIYGLFEYTTNDESWKLVKYYFLSDTNNLKRIEINLYFTVNDNQTEFLQDFTIDKIYKTNSVSIQSGKLKVGSQPVFILVSNSDTTFLGASQSNHFHGTIKTKTDLGWYDFSGSYCRSTVPEKPLNKSDTVFSWVPNYSPGDEYKIKRRGTYKYAVLMGLEKFSNGTPTVLINSGQTRRRTRIFCELEIEFKIE